MAQVVGSDGRPHFVYTISGIRVEFPAKAYPSQIAMMDKVIRGLQRGQHCLLESPTGSGKTLALLCASLAWQRAEAENVRKFNENLEANFRASLRDDIRHAAATKDVKPTKPGDRAANKMDDKVGSGNNVNDMSAYYSEDDQDMSDDDFQPNKRKKMSKSPPDERAATRATSAIMKKLEENAEAAVTELADAFQELPVEEPYFQRKRKIPKIFFGTRTHKQITQVVKEFRRTVYCKTPMAVLASREHTCIHPEVSTSSNKNEGCRILNDPRLARQQQEENPDKFTGGKCVYRFRGQSKLKTQSHMINYGFDSGWDIEDIVGLGRRLRACPYYATRDLMEQAHIIFSPYNYLIDPRVRASMKIPVKDNIIILDEAHNIEDAARESAGGTFSQEDFRLALNDCEKVASRHQTMKDEIEQLAAFASFMMKWIDRQATNMKSVGIDREVNIITGTEFVAGLSLGGYDAEGLENVKRISDYIFNESAESEYTDKEKSNNEPQLSSATQTVLEGFLVVMNMMLGFNQVHRDDYRVVLTKQVERKRKGNFFGKGNVQSQWTYALHLWCLNPAVVLKEVRTSTRSIVVTSGTLSPLASYQSELDIEFNITLEANHVIPANRVWVGSIAKGPRDFLLNGTFRCVSTFDYQDELGRLVLSVCQTIPHGVLCFLPSYSLLEKLVARWQDTGLWDHLCNHKTMVCESRESSAFEETLRQFYSAIDESQKALNYSLDSSGENHECLSERVNSPSGAFMMAVCRGKVSEGLDFTDNNARAVICVGIPFPNFKDTQVELKREYNDKRSSSSSLLNGSEWYEIQAFRALNQALGRCIRHKADWGAILLVDDRFGKSPRYVNQLSKWVRGSIRHHNSFEPMMASLKEFTKNFVAEDAALLASQKQEQQQLLQSQEHSSQSEEPVCFSPYFTRIKSEKVANSASSSQPDIICLDTSGDSDVAIENSPAASSPLKPATSKKKPFASLFANSNKLSMSQRKLAAENGSRYFQSMNQASEENPNSE